MQVVASAFDLLIINRYNIAWGIPDKWFYMFGDAVIGPAVMMFAFMPAVVLTSKLVPKGLESTTYALLAGFQNFGGSCRVSWAFLPRRRPALSQMKTRSAVFLRANEITKSRLPAIAP